MKKLGPLIVFCFLTLAAFSQQADSTNRNANKKTVFGIKAGINVSMFSASINSESKAKVELNAGIYIKTPLSPKISFRPEIYYSNQGQKDNHIVPPNGPSIGTSTTTMHYINVPILFEFGRKVSFQVGPQIGILVKGTEKGFVASTDVNDDLKDVMTGADFGLVFGIGFEPIKRFNFGARYNMGLTDIYNGDDDPAFP